MSVFRKHGVEGEVHTGNMSVFRKHGVEGEVTQQYVWRERSQQQYECI